MIVREATTEDLEQIFDMYLEFDRSMKNLMPEEFQVYRTHREDFNNITKQHMIKKFNDDNMIFYVAEDNNNDNNNIAGYILGTAIPSEDPIYDRPMTGVIKNVYIKPDYRGKGVSSKLRDTIYDWFKEKDCKFVELAVLSTNPAHEIYKKWGFTDIRQSMVKKI